MSPLHPAANGLDGMLQIKSRVAGKFGRSRQQLVGLLRREFRKRPAPLVGNRRIGKVHKLVGTEGFGGRDRDIFHRAIEHFPGRRIADVGDDDDVAAIKT